MEQCSKCHRRLIVVDPARKIHPLCAPANEVWVTPDELAELEARYWPTPNPAAQEANPE